MGFLYFIDRTVTTHTHTRILTNNHKMAKSSKASKSTTRRRTAKRSFKRYINRTLQSAGKGQKLTLSGKAVKIVDSFVRDMFERLATQSAQVARTNKRSTLSTKELQTAVKLLLPGELAKHAMSEGAKAVSKAI